MLDICKMNCQPSKRAFFYECCYRCTTSMTGQPHTSLGTSHSIWKSNFMTDFEGPENWTPRSPNFYQLHFQYVLLHEKMFYERKVDTRDEILWRIFDAARRVNNAAILLEFTFSTAKWVTMCIQTDVGHFENILNRSAQFFPINKYANKMWIISTSSCVSLTHISITLENRIHNQTTFLTGKSLRNKSWNTDMKGNRNVRSLQGRLKSSQY
jgi:hypothetical protein